MPASGLPACSTICKSEIGRHMPSQLSGGEARRVGIARALANDPKIILADEPTAPLGSERAGIVMDLLRRIASEQQATIICVTHDETAFDRFDRIFRLRDGRLVSVEKSASHSHTPALVPAR
jgi:putative ABC transport system ATP-binding protein